MDNQSVVDKINASFYGRFQYPPPPAVFERVKREGFWQKMLAQDIGYYEQEDLFPSSMRIWVAGCGTNQAVFTALKYPEAKVIGSDLSVNSLDQAFKSAQELGLRNLELRQESINDVAYTSEFDLVICTGVIHHNANPQIALQSLTRALRPDGIMELMVYNRFHRILTSAFQGAIRILAGTENNPSWQEEFEMGRMLAETFRRGNLMSAFLAQNAQLPDALFADSLLQPVEYSYTVGSLKELVENAGLELLIFSIDQFSRSTGAESWNLEFKESLLRDRYEALDDYKRWEITNLLLGEESPMLWFYLQHKNSSRSRKTEKEICDQFLQTRFRRVICEKEVFTRDLKHSFVSTKSKVMQFPGKPKLGTDASKIYAAIDENAEISKTFERLGIEQSFYNVQQLRSLLSTSANPFLEAW
jgi:SAM-dependent methyltransferase